MEGDQASDKCQNKSRYAPVCVGDGMLCQHVIVKPTARGVKSPLTDSSIVAKVVSFDVLAVMVLVGSGSFLL